jgi:glycosyltransferase involved in cell wall biosynthesis
LPALSARCLTTACDKRNAAHKAYRVARGAVQRLIGRFPSGVTNYIALSRRSVELLLPYLPRGHGLWSLDNIIGVTRAPPVDVASNATLMVVGRLDPEKGVLLAASAAARAKLPIRFVGDGPLRQEIEATGASVTGWLSTDDVFRELATARCLIFPSLWYETFGLVVTEAAARGVPAIVSDISAPADRVTGGGGWLFRAGDSRGLADRLELTRDDAAIRREGEAAYRNYWAHPADPRSHTNALLSIYAEVLDRARANIDFNAAASAGCSRPRQATHSTPASALARAANPGEPNQPTTSP